MKSHTLAELMHWHWSHLKIVFFVAGRNTRVSVVKRDLYKSETGNKVNADINGALNIMRKYVTKAHDYLVQELNEFICTSWKQFVFSIKHKIHELVHHRVGRGLMTVLVETTSSVPKSNRPHEIPRPLGRGGLLLSLTRYLLDIVHHL